MAFRREHGMDFHGNPDLGWRSSSDWHQSGLNLKPLSSYGSSHEPPMKRIKGTFDHLNDSCSTDTFSSHPEFNKDTQSDDNNTSVPVPYVSPLEKLLQCLEKNPVSGLVEYTQFMSQHCEFVLVHEAGPSHDPRFTMRVIIDGRQFPDVEASSKKTARKEAASAALRTLIREEQGEEVVEEAPVRVTPKAETEVLPSSSSSLPSAKSPISVLMELSQKKGVACKIQLVSHDGPLHEHQFSFCVTFGDRVFPAVSANNTKVAKQLAAEAALKELEKEPGGTLAPEKVPKPKVSTKTVIASDKPTLDSHKAARSDSLEDLMSYLRTDPMKGVLEYSRAKGCAAQFNLVNMSGPPDHPVFVYQTKVGSRWFPAASAHSKNKAREDAAEIALRTLILEAEKAKFSRGYSR